jgi:hypothetical protein
MARKYINENFVSVNPEAELFYISAAMLKDNLL